MPSVPYCILGIDPGTNVLGYGLLQVAGKELSLLDMGTVRMKRQASQSEKLSQIFSRVDQLIRRYEPRALAIEAPFYGKNVQSMLKLGRAQGVAIAAALKNGLPFQEYSPRRIKQAVTGNGNAAKEQVAAMLVQLLGGSMDSESLDATDALATALCHYYSALATNAGKGKQKYTGWESFLKDNPGRIKD
jgi:crossover junction endodeoxyribonuclease RuvC